MEREDDGGRCRGVMRKKIGDMVGDRSRKGDTSKGVRRCEGGGVGNGGGSGDRTSEL